MWLLYVSSGEADSTPSFAQQSVLDQGTSIIEMATAAADEEVPVRLYDSNSKQYPWFHAPTSLYVLHGNYKDG